MKTIFILLFSVAFEGICSAQITITADEYFAVNYQNKSILTSFYQDSTQLANGLTMLKSLIQTSGPGKTWDFTGEGYTPFTSDPNTRTALLPYPSGAPLAEDPDFTSATYVFKIANTNPSNPTYYAFYKFNSTGLWLLGQSRLDSNGAKVKVLTYTPGLQLMKFPLTFGTSWQEVTQIKNVYYPAGTTVFDTITTVVDSWGTLIIPSSASNQCLRMQKIENRRIESPTGAVNYSTITTYSWLAESGAGAGMIVFAPSDAPYYSTYTSATPNSVGGQVVNGDNLNLYLSANPIANNASKLFYTLKKNSIVKITIFDALGKSKVLLNRIQDAGENSYALDVNNLAPGMYILHVNADGMTAMSKIIIQK